MFTVNYLLTNKSSVRQRGKNKTKHQTKPEQATPHGHISEQSDPCSKALADPPGGFHEKAWPSHRSTLPCFTAGEDPPAGDRKTDDADSV